MEVCEFSGERFSGTFSSSISDWSVCDAWEAREVVTIGFGVSLKDSEKSGNFAAGLGDVLIFYNDEIFTNLFGAVGWLDIDND